MTTIKKSYGRNIIPCSNCIRFNSKPRTCHSYGVYFAETKMIDNKPYLILVCRSCKGVTVLPLDKHQHIKEERIIHCKSKCFKVYVNRLTYSLRCLDCNESIRYNRRL